MHKNQKGFTVTEALVIVVVLIIFIGGGWYVWYNSQNNKQGINNAIYNTGASRDGN